VPIDNNGSVRSAVFAPDGSRILTASSDDYTADDNTARLWDRDGKPLATLQGHTGPVRSAVFAPDGSRIPPQSLPSTPSLWRPSEGRFFFCWETPRRVEQRRNPR
jgi:WD40 repeat protein